MAQHAVTAGTADDVEEAAGSLRVYNIVIGLIHLAQGIAMLLLSNDFTLPVTRTFLTGPPGTAPTQET